MGDHNHNHKLIKNLGTCFGLGEMPFMPGTCGTLGGIPIFLLLTYLRKFFLNVMVFNSFYYIVFNKSCWNKGNFDCYVISIYNF